MNMLIGNRAGADITNQSDIVIIGDDILLEDIKNKTRDDVIFISDNVGIGKYVFGEYNTLYDILKKNLINN